MAETLVETGSWLRRNAGGIVVGGAVGALAVGLLVPTEDTPPKPNHSIGVTCIEPGAEVSAIQSGSTVSFACFAADGHKVLVSGLGEVGTGNVSQAPGYTDVINFYAEGNGIRYGIDCGKLIGEVTVWNTLQRPDNQPNSLELGVTGCEGISNTNRDGGAGISIGN